MYSKRLNFVQLLRKSLIRAMEVTSTLASTFARSRQVYEVTRCFTNFISFLSHSPRLRSPEAHLHFTPRSHYSFPWETCGGWEENIVLPYGSNDNKTAVLTGGFSQAALRGYHECCESSPQKNTRVSTQ